VRAAVPQVKRLEVIPEADGSRELLFSGRLYFGLLEAGKGEVYRVLLPAAAGRFL